MGLVVFIEFILSILVAQFRDRTRFNQDMESNARNKNKRLFSPIQGGSGFKKFELSSSRSTTLAGSVQNGVKDADDCSVAVSNYEDIEDELKNEFIEQNDEFNQLIKEIQILRSDKCRLEEKIIEFSKGSSSYEKLEEQYKDRCREYEYMVGQLSWDFFCKVCESLTLLTCQGRWLLDFWSPVAICFVP